METRIQKWGSSLALKIPEAFAAETNLQQNTVVDITLQNGALVVAPVRPKYTLEELLEQVTEENLHAEQDFGPAVGAEAW